MALTKVPNELSSTPSIVDGGNATAITIDSSENVLIGQTSPSGSATGMYFRPGQESGINSDGDSALQLNRLTNDGAVLRFYQGGTNVGSIDSRIGQGITINSSSGADGILSNGGSYSYGWNAAYFYPRVDATSDLGFSGGLRFKDLYLSGGVVFPDASAATGASVNGNKLDSYEEGSFTPTAVTGFSGFSTLQSARYTKIGNIVHIQLYTTGLSGKTSALLHMGGLPFTCKVNGWAPGSMNYSGTTMSNPHPRARAGEARIDFKKNGDGTMSGTDITGHLLFQLTYKTDD